MATDLLLWAVTVRQVCFFCACNDLVIKWVIKQNESSSVKTILAKKGAICWTIKRLFFSKFKAFLGSKGYF